MGAYSPILWYFFSSPTKRRFPKEFTISLSLTSPVLRLWSLSIILSPLTKTSASVSSGIIIVNSLEIYQREGLSLLISQNKTPCFRRGSQTVALNGLANWRTPIHWEGEGVPKLDYLIFIVAFLSCCEAMLSSFICLKDLMRTLVILTSGMLFMSYLFYL